MSDQDKWQIDDSEHDELLEFYESLDKGTPATDLSTKKSEEEIKPNAA